MTEQLNQSEKRGILGLKKIAPGVYESEYGDRITKSDICAGILIAFCVTGMIVGGCMRIFQKSGKEAETSKPVVVQQANAFPQGITNALAPQNVRK